MITLTKTWERRSTTSVVSSTDDQLRNVLVSIKNLLIASGHWTLVYSCDSVSVGIGPGNDKWVTYANLVHAAPGVAHSWIVLQNTNTDVSGTFQLCIDYCHVAGGSGSAHHFATILCSHAGYNNDGSTTNRPTAISDECLIANDQQYMSTPNDKIRINLFTSSDGQCTRLIMTSSASLASGCKPWIIDRLNNPPSWLTHPYFVSCIPAVAAGDYSTLTGLMQPSFKDYCFSSGHSRCYHNSTVVWATIATIGSSSNYLRTQNGRLANISDGSYSLIPALVVSTSSTVPGFLGELFDLYLLPGNFGDDAESGNTCFLSPAIYLPSTDSDLGLFSHGVFLYGNNGVGGLY